MILEGLPLALWIGLAILIAASFGGVSGPGGYDATATWVVRGIFVLIFAGATAMFVFGVRRMRRQVAARLEADQRSGRTSGRSAGAWLRRHPAWRMMLLSYGTNCVVLVVTVLVLNVVHAGHGHRSPPLWPPVVGLAFGLVFSCWMAALGSLGQRPGPAPRTGDPDHIS